jgi:GR25 family glycosyltransferase involved in LPS biosynthesis
MESIDGVLFINLAHRQDRLVHLLQQLEQVLTPDEIRTKVHRIDAVYVKENGALGCGQSHIRALEYAQEQKNWKTVLILEDDFTFREPPVQGNQRIKKLLDHLASSSSSSWDVALIAYHHGFQDFRKMDVVDDGFVRRVYSAASAVGYIVHRDYIPTLLQNFKESMADMALNGRRHENCIDQYWQRIMPMGKWYTMTPEIGYNYTNYSDIEKSVVNYDHWRR